MSSANGNGKAQVISGNEAAGYGAIAAGARFYGGYPITPSTEVAELMARELPKIGGRFIQMEDEIASLGAVIGASLAGLKSFTATSGPGFSLMQEHIGFAAMAEVPCVIINVMRAGPSTGLPTMTAQGDIMQARYGSHGDYPIVVLCPNSVLECFTLTVRAFNLSEKLRLPVILLSDEVVGHMCEKVTFPAPSELEVVNRLRPTVPPDWYRHYEATPSGIAPMASFGEGYRYHVTGLHHDTYGFPTSEADEVLELAEKFVHKETRNEKDLVQLEEFHLDDADICIIAYGSVSRSARQAVRLLRQKGFRAGLLRPQIIWPFPAERVARAIEGKRYVLVPEMNVGQMRKEVERVSYSHRGVIAGLNVINARFITADQIVERVLSDVRANTSR